MKVDFKECTKSYFDELKKELPLFVDNLDFTNTVANYFMSTYAGLAIDGVSDYDLLFENRVDKCGAIELSSEILSSINPVYKDDLLNKFKSRDMRFTLNLFNRSPMVKKRNGVAYLIDYHDVRTVLSLIHEYFHLLHMDSTGLEFDDSEYIYYTEMVAMLGEWYAIGYMLKNKIMVEDVKMYIKLSLSSFVVKSSNTLNNGIFLYTFSETSDVKEEDVLKYAKFKEFLPGFHNIDMQIDRIKKYNYLEHAMYIYGIIYSVMIAKQMNEDKNNIDRFNKVMSNIKDNGVISLIEEFGLSDLSKDEYKLYDAYMYLDSIFCDVFYEKKEGYQKKLGELW